METLFSTRTDREIFFFLKSGNQEDLKIGNKYHIKNGYISGEIWMENVYLTDIEDCGGFMSYTFTFGNGSEIVIDGDTLYKFNRQNNMKCYQYVKPTYAGLW
jgi:hypothetical protein